MEIKCPECKKEPIRGKRWHCEKCGETFDTVETKAKCPNPDCGNSWEWTQCEFCYERSPHKDWWTKNEMP